jgi:hypothetical protein
MNPRPRSKAILVCAALAAGGLAAIAGCGADPRPPAAAPAAFAPVALAGRPERDTTSIRAIKTAIKKHFEVATLERVATVKTLDIVPAPAWNEFVFEGVLVEDDLTTGFLTFKIAGVYDALAKEVDVKQKELVGFSRTDPRAPKGADR